MYFQGASRVRNTFSKPLKCSPELNKIDSMGKRYPKCRWWCSAASFFVFFALLRRAPPPSRRVEHVSNARSMETTLVTYAYAEGLGNGGEIDLHNFRFFLKLILTERTPGTYDEADLIRYNIVVSGKVCTPCEDTLPRLLKSSRRRKASPLTILYRENYGMDFGGYNYSLQWEEVQGSMKNYKYFVFINSSLRGPFMPKWTPRDFHFTKVLTGFFREDQRVKLVGSYITCLPAIEPKPGPIMESLFFAVDSESVNWLKEDGVFSLRAEKAGAILHGE